jgi:hypothetical protein
MAFLKCLFVDNRRGTIYLGANFATERDTTDQHAHISHVVDHCTFVGNEGNAGAAGGQMSWANTETPGRAFQHLSNSIVALADSTYSLQATKLDSVTHTAFFGNGTMTVIDGSAFADTLKGRNPYFNDTFTPVHEHYIARRTGMVDCVGTCYMGWEPWLGTALSQPPATPYRGTRSRHRG